MSEKSFKNYKVIETENMDAKEMQKILNDATDGFPEMQIDHVIGTKIIFSYESLLNEKGRAEARAEKAIGAMLNKKLFSNTASR